MAEAGSPPRISVLIVNYNGKHHLKECLDSLAAQTCSQMEVVLVDNASKDGSWEFLEEKYPWVSKFRADRNLGFAGGNNFGGRYCRGDYVLLLNNDTRVEKDSLEILLRATEENPEYRVFAPLLLDYSDPTKVDSGGDTFYWMGPPISFTGYPTTLFQKPRPVALVKGAGAFYPRDLLDKLGWFDEDFFLNYEDIDLALRARHTGAKIMFLPQAKIYHKGFASLGGGRSSLGYYWTERNAQLAILKTFPLSVLLRFLPGFLMNKLGRQFYSSIRAGCFWASLRGNLASLPLIPRMWARRKRILAESTISAAEFCRLFRGNWLEERLKFKKGEFEIPI